MWEGSWACIELLRRDASWLTEMLRGRRVVELGSGIGLLGLCAAAAGAHVLLTDVPAIVTTTLQPNVAANEAHGAADADAADGSSESEGVGGPLEARAAWRDAVCVGRGYASCQPLNWLEPVGEQSCGVDGAPVVSGYSTYANDPRNAQVILAAECVWLSDLVEPFVHTVATLLHAPPPPPPPPLPSQPAGKRLPAAALAERAGRVCVLAFRERATETSTTFSTAARVLDDFERAGCTASLLGTGDAPESPGLVTTFYAITAASAAAVGEA
jgi:predicted nicotinamide N-methyase